MLSTVRTIEDQEYLWEEYRRYIKEVPMTRRERHELYQWVSKGHSISESPGSKYPPDKYPEPDFLDTIREDLEIEKELAGKTSSEQEQFLKDYIGYSDESIILPATDRLKEMKDHIGKIEHDLFYLWMYLSSEGLINEAQEFLRDFEEDPIPFGWE